MQNCHIDHITVTAPTLEAGARFVRQALGVAPQPGGQHLRMGTHNLLLRLGSSLFLEVIAPDPTLSRPIRPRWFGLDDLLPDAAPRLATWVVRTSNIKESSAACPEVLGTIAPMHRGALDWLITIPEDGALPLDGVGPALIEWAQAAHPAAGLQDHGLSLGKLELFHAEPQRIARLLSNLALEGQVEVHATRDGQAAHLAAQIHTPQGPRWL
ncbi:VOC family protein [Janthinobacterium sp. PC23-8]|uniref:VOC family protein n=1 Tax=Janthinobacterium sp. PC23-8 TaxID=2012679 RepID=UPI0020CC442B|nr:VOC family protein [Janthinobacterium sp. PC23-8]